MMSFPFQLVGRWHALIEERHTLLTTTRVERLGKVRTPLVPRFVWSDFQQILVLQWLPTLTLKLLKLCES